MVTATTFRLSVFFSSCSLNNNKKMKYNKVRTDETLFEHIIILIQIRNRQKANIKDENNNKSQETLYKIKTLNYINKLTNK